MMKIGFLLGKCADRETLSLRHSIGDELPKELVKLHDRENSKTKLTKFTRMNT